MNLTLYSLIY